MYRPERGTVRLHDGLGSHLFQENPDLIMLLKQIVICYVLNFPVYLTALLLEAHITEAIML